MQQYKATLQPLHSKQRTGPKPQLPPRPSPQVLARTISAPPRPSPLVLARTISTPPRQQNNSVLRRQGNVKKRQLQTQSALFPATFSISSSSPRQRPRHQSTSMADLDQRREFEVKGDVKQHQRETQSGFFPSTFSIPSASPRRRLRRQSTSSVTDLDLRGKETLTVRDRYRSEPGAGVDYTTTGHLRAARSSEWPMEPKSPRRPPRPPPILHLPKPNLGTAQKNTKPSSLGPGEAKSKPARPPPPLYKPRPPMPLPQSEGLLKRNSEQADDSDLTYCYVYERVQRNLERQVPEYKSNCNSRAHSTSAIARDDLDDFDRYETLDAHTYSELLATTREKEHDYTPILSYRRYMPLTRSTMNREHVYTQARSSRRYTPLIRSTMTQASKYHDVPTYSASQ